MMQLREQFDRNITFNLDCRMETLLTAFEKVVSIWKMFGVSYRQLPSFHCFQEEPLSSEFDKMRPYELWQNFAADYSFEDFEMMLSFANRVFFTHSDWENLTYIQLVRSGHYQMMEEFEAYRDSLPDDEWIPKW